MENLDQLFEVLESKNGVILGPRSIEKLLLITREEETSEEAKEVIDKLLVEMF